MFQRIIILCLGTLVFQYSISQIDSTQVDSIILSQLINVKNNPSNDSFILTSVPDDNSVMNYFSQKGINYDSLCSTIELYREVYGWIGVKYRYAGLTKKGVDCAGFVTNICNRVYGCELSGSARDHFKKCIPIEKNELEEGDLVFFDINKGQISHVGLYLGNNKFVHAAVHGGVMINDLNEKYYNKYYYISGRLIQTPQKK